jgi:multimeric flavodoxin WrbA
MFKTAIGEMNGRGKTFEGPKRKDAVLLGGEAQKESARGQLAMKVLGIFGSPRKKGNSDLLLEAALEEAKSAGADVSSLYVRDLKMSGCRECGGCSSTGVCVVQDDMQKVYPLIQEADVIILATPVFFYGFSAQLKALIDRGQALWSGRMLRKKGDQRKVYDSGRGYLIAVGATGGKHLFEGVELTARYFFDALDMSYEGGLFFRKVEARGSIAQDPDALNKAREFGKNIVLGPARPPG